MRKCYAMAGEVFGILDEWTPFGELSMYTRFFKQGTAIVYDWSFHVKKARYSITYCITPEELEIVNNVEFLVDRIKALWDHDVQDIKAAKPQERVSPEIKSGTILNEGGVIFKVLEDTTEHGCPLVEIIDPGVTRFIVGDKTYRTINKKE